MLPCVNSEFLSESRYNKLQMILPRHGETVRLFSKQHYFIVTHDKINRVVTCDGYLLQGSTTRVIKQEVDLKLFEGTIVNLLVYNLWN